MNTSLAWIKEYVPDLNVTAQEYVDAMTLSGTKVEGYECIAEDLDNVVVGQILKIEKHPDADKLIICQVDVGQEEPVQIVTGAPNVKEQDKVPVVLHGGRVAGNHDGERVKGGVKITRGKLRGVESEGMMCSIEELGSTKELYPDAPEYGIYIFDKDTKVGEDVAKVLGLDDIVVEYEVTSNRVDCFAVIGIAREAAATFSKEFHYPTIKETGNEEDAKDYIAVEIKDEELCSRYIARVVKNVKIGPSPLWMQRRLASVGIRPINNVVDITNYVMEEFGQPMHAYDMSTIAGQKIVVRCAQKGEKFTTLDGQERTLDDKTLMICDGEKPIGIAGIMGGENSMITEQVENVVFEAACFDGTNIRLSSKKLGMRTDASGKFEKGLDPNQAMLAINRCCQFMEEFGAGEVVGGCVDVYPKMRTGNRVKLEPDKINHLLGTTISKEDMIAYLDKVDLKFDKETEEIVVPSWRQDIHVMADLAEEVIRFYGYDKVPTTLPYGRSTIGGKSKQMVVEEKASRVAHYNGFSQAMFYSFESPKVFEKLRIPVTSDLRRTVTVTNPLGEDFSIMRTVTLNGMLNSLATNYNRRNKNVRLYELGNVYLPKQLPVTELPDERMKLTLGMYGEGDFFELKGIVEEVLSECGVKQELTFLPTDAISYFHPGRCAEVLIDGKVVAELGEVHPLVLSNYEIKEKVYVAVLDIRTIVEYSNYAYKFEEIAKYPAVNRDLSMLCSKGILAGEIEHCIRENAGAILEELTLFDVYEGSQIAAGYKSLAYSLTFRAKDKTLEEEEITQTMTRIVNGLSKMNVELRQ
ncbi:phenylalanyl-tRNA synthetase beta subunit [Lachnospiraceae bacterium XBB1006]|nr:phenylalanyl-tRNA synthetase beta subunit [Lachnospiraceae bacterium XBB1006]